MRRMVGLNMMAGLTVTIAAGTGAGLLAPAVAATSVTITDPVGDVINRDTNAKLASAPADIVSATVEPGAAAIVLSFKTQQMADPATDPNWASPNTFVSWQVDDNGDGRVEDLIHYSSDPSAPGGITADLTHWSGPGIPAMFCNAQGSFSPDSGYTVIVSPACLGNPTAISYRVQLTYDMNPGAAKPLLAFDVAPDQGLAGQLPIDVAPAPATTSPGSSAQPSPASIAPNAASPAPPATAPTGKPAAPRAVKPATPAPIQRRTPSVSAPSAPASPPLPGTAATSRPGGLAATGTSSTRRLSTLGGALLLLGGLGVMTFPNRRVMNQ